MPSTLFIHNAPHEFRGVLPDLLPRNLLDEACQSPRHSRARCYALMVTARVTTARHNDGRDGRDRIYWRHGPRERDFCRRAGASRQSGTRPIQSMSGGGGREYASPKFATL
jgi:hypothetical protein